MPDSTQSIEECLCDWSGGSIETVSKDCPAHGTAELCGKEHYYVKGLRCMKELGHEGTHQNGVIWR